MEKGTLKLIIGVVAIVVLVAILFEIIGPLWAGFFGAVIRTIFWLLVIIGLILLIVYFASRWEGEKLLDSERPFGSDAAMDDLRGRYARGEIDRDTYRERKKEREER